MLICAFARARECVYARSRNGTPAIGVAARVTSSLLCLLCLTVDNLDCIGGTQRSSATAGRTIDVYCDNARVQTPIRPCLRIVAGRLHGLSQTVRDLSRTVSLVCQPDSPFGPATKPGVEGVACTASSASPPSRGGLPRARPRKDASAALVFVAFNLVQSETEPHRHRMGNEFQSPLAKIAVPTGASSNCNQLQGGFKCTDGRCAMHTSGAS